MQVSPRMQSPVRIVAKTPPTPPAPSALTQIAKRLGKPNDLRLRETLAIWNLHGLTTAQAKTRIRPLVGASPYGLSLRDHFSRERNVSEFIHDWRLAALRRGIGCDRDLARDILDLDYKTGFIDKAKPVQQDLRHGMREKILVKELANIETYIKYEASQCVFTTHFVGSSGMLSDVCTRLTERAIQAFRWTYPFIDNPGKVMCRAVTNYTNNIKREAFAQRYHKHLTFDFSFLGKIIEDTQDVFEMTQEDRSNPLVEAIQELTPRDAENLFTILRTQGVEMFADKMSLHMNASPQRILRLMKGFNVENT